MILNRAVGGLRRTLWALLPVVWLATAAVLAWRLPDGSAALPAFAVAPALTCAAGGRRCGVVGMGVLALAVLAGALADGSLRVSGPVIGTVATLLAVMGAGAWTAGRRALLSAELDRTREIAVAAQQVLMRPLPYRVGGWTVTGEYLSASRGARVGGDFYEVLATPYGVRALIGDARGHGLPAIGIVAALLGTFREAAHQEADLAGVVRRLDGSLHRHLRDRAQSEHPAVGGAGPREPVAEEFATAQLVQLADDGVFQAVNCGHPQPYLLGAADGASPLPLGEPLPPLGLFDPASTVTPVTCGRVATGEGLLLHTDGLADARDPAGRFFPLPAALAAATRAPLLSGRDVAAALRAAVVRHTGGDCADDVALLVLVRDPCRVTGRRRSALVSGVPLH